MRASSTFKIETSSLLEKAGPIGQVLFWYGMSGLPARPRIVTCLGLGLGVRRILPIPFLLEQDQYYLLILFAYLIYTDSHHPITSNVL